MIGITGKIKKCICPECLQESLYLECFEWKARSFWKNQIDNRNMNGTRSLPKHNHYNVSLESILPLYEESFRLDYVESMFHWK